MKIQAYSNATSQFNLLIHRLGLIDQDYSKEDYALGALARFDHAHIEQGVVVSMHEHVNDEIFSYL